MKTTAVPVADMTVSESFYLVKRNPTCDIPNFNQCQGAPNGFCCRSDAHCLVLASNTTVICCPSSSDCAVIQPITCDISQQNSTNFPNASIKTTNLTATLPSCDGECCPLGYSCTGTACKLNIDQGNNLSHVPT